MKSKEDAKKERLEKLREHGIDVDKLTKRFEQFKPVLMPECLSIDEFILMDNDRLSKARREHCNNCESCRDIYKSRIWEDSL